MIEFLKRLKLTMFILGMIITIHIISFHFYKVLAEPGSYNDPVITLSYLQEVFMPLIRQEIDNKTKKTDTGGGENFDVITLQQGQKLIGEAGTELILRMGQAIILSTEKGGLADTTWGEDLHDGENMPPNHLLIVPVSDGRGLVANTEVLVMVKGLFTIN